MNGGSLGLRTGSYGSLQQQLQNGATLPIQSTPISIRKPPKMLPPGSREKERIILPWICRFCGRRKVGMLLLLIASAAVILSFISVLNKDEDAPASLEMTFLSSDHVWNMVNYGIKSPSASGHPLVSVNNDKEKISSSVNRDNEADLSFQTQSPSLFPVPHPCENFSRPHLQIDKKRTGPRPCPVCYVPVEQVEMYMPAWPSKSPVLKNLTYVIEENSFSNESSGGSAFGGHPSLNQRKDYFDIKESMTVHCGFVSGKKPGQGTGFDIDYDDLLEMDKCHGIVVASAIFGKYDVMQQPKNIGEVSKRTVCFYMFLDEETEAYIKNSSSLDNTKRMGLWRIVVVRNLPYEDARRNGKVPKLLLHRLFPNARFSVWVDGKLELVVDPYQVLERFLWRHNVSFAISRHYRRFDVFEEAEANKAAGKYDNASIDYQIQFYKGEGLTHYSELKLPITSDVPEGCVIIREHIPITNLFTCLWFNEVDRFTSRDQLSFSTVRDKIMLRVNWTVDMFMDCERRNFVLQVQIPTGQVYAINDSLTAEAAADDYEACLKHLVNKGVLQLKPATGFPKFDLMLLGMGPDGHIASLFPDHPLLGENRRWVTSINKSPKPPCERITLTIPVINSSAYIALVVTGVGKADVLRQVFGAQNSSSVSLPVQMIKLDDGALTWFTDKAAASRL